MFKQKFWLTIFFIFQLFSTAMIAVGMLPASFAYLNLAVQLAAIIFFDLEHALFSVLLSIPFYIVLPNPKLDTFSQWRIDFVVLFAVVWLKQRKLGAKLELFSWDKYLKYYFYFIVLSALFVAHDYSAAFKKLIFVVNIYLLYVVVLNVVKNKEAISRTLKVSLLSLFTFVALGFAQMFASYSTKIYYFWQYWSEFIARAYYGNTFAQTSTYSNSWFSFPNHVPTLRMFSILPDSHAFAVVCMFTMLFASAAMFFTVKKKHVWLWAIVAVSALGLVFSGTRGVWAGALVPLVLLIYFYSRHYGRKLLRPMFWPILIFAFAIVASPLIQKGSALIFKGQTQDNFLQRASSIYDLGETSNAGRLQIWKYILNNVVANHPLLGVGYGNFTSVITPQQEKEFNLPARYISAHSLYLEILAELGLIGLFIFVNYFRKVFETYWQFFKKHYLYSEDGFVFFAVSSALYLSWLLAYLVFDITILNDRVLMYFFLVLALSANIIGLYKIES